MDIISLKYPLVILGSLFIYYLIDQKYRIPFLAIVSCSLIALFNYYILIYVVFYSVINFYIALKIPDSPDKKLLFRAGVIFSILQLVILKYASFAIDPFFSLLGDSIRVSRLSEILVPIGISYFSLQGIGYLINIKMGWEKPERNFMNFLLYIVFYPKFLSGPIERSNHFLPQLRDNKVFNGQQVSEGLRIALFGFFKKVAIASPMAPYISGAFSDLNSLDGNSLLILFVLLPQYLYFDFSGYTDIAIGFAKMFGIELLPNFNRPFFSENMTVFWKRFHISLSSWFNDYVFRQVCFKYRRWGTYASVYGVFLTWMLFGVWHGAGWNFMALGLLLALVIIYEFFTRNWRMKLFSKFPDFPRKWIGRIFTYLFYCCCMVFFFAPDLSSVFLFFSKMTSVSWPFVVHDMSTKPFMVLFYIPLFLFFELLKNDYKGLYDKLELSWLGTGTGNRIIRWSVYATVLTIIFVLGLKSQQFVYANF